MFVFGVKGMLSVLAFFYIRDAANWSLRRNKRANIEDRKLVDGVVSIAYLLLFIFALITIWSY